MRSLTWLPRTENTHANMKKLLERIMNSMQRKANGGHVAEIAAASSGGLKTLALPPPMCLL